MNWVPPRRHDPEWMDRPGNSVRDLACALRDIRLANRFLGGRRALLQAIDRFLGELEPGGVLRVLDVGTGDADLPLAMVAHGLRRGRRVEVTALERDPATARIAAGRVAQAATCKSARGGDPRVRVVRADALAPPFREGAFDLVTASLFLHHHDDALAADLLQRFRRLARRAVLVNDLRRHRLACAFIGVAARATRRHPMFVHDAPLSVLRGFTARELRDLARRSGARSAHVVRRWPFRLVLTIPVAGAPA